MSSLDNSQYSDSGLQLPGLFSQLSPAEQLPFPESNPTFLQSMPQPALNRVSGPTTPAPDLYSSDASENPTQQLPDENSSMGITRQLAFNGSPAVTRLLPDIQTGTLASVSSTTSLRQPIVIPATGKKSRGTMRPPRGRTWVTSSLVLGMFIMITLLTGFIVLPLATDNRLGFNLSANDNKIYQTTDPNSNPNLIAQAATATAIAHQDGYDPTSNNNGGALYTGSGVTPDRFAFGQCTYWADLRYHQLTGNWVDWSGNAYQWASGARAAGWNVSTMPHVPSIIVLQGGTQGAGYYGHVAVVERINSDGSVYTTNMNWYNGGGGWDRESGWTFRPGPGVLFVWHA